jgi:hypothetical protein
VRVTLPDEGSEPQDDPKAKSAYNRLGILEIQHDWETCAGSSSANRVISASSRSAPMVTESIILWNEGQGVLISIVRCVCVYSDIMIRCHPAVHGSRTAWSTSPWRGYDKSHHTPPPKRGMTMEYGLDSMLITLRQGCQSSEFQSAASRSVQTAVAHLAHGRRQVIMDLMLIPLPIRTE